MTNPVCTNYVPEQLTAGDFPTIKEAGVLAAGQKLEAGAVLGQVTATGHYKLALAAAEDGSQTPVAILDAPADATEAATPCVARLTGEVLGSELTLGTGITAAAAKAALRPYSIFIR